MSASAYAMLAEHFDQSLGLQRRLRMPRAVILAVCISSAAML